MEERIGNVEKKQARQNLNMLEMEMARLIEDLGKIHAEVKQKNDGVLNPYRKTQILEKYMRLWETTEEYKNLGGDNSKFIMYFNPNVLILHLKRIIPNGTVFMSPSEYTKLSNIDYVIIFSPYKIDVNTRKKEIKINGSGSHDTEIASVLEDALKNNYPDYTLSHDFRTPARKVMRVVGIIIAILVIFFIVDCLIAVVTGLQQAL